MFNQLNREAILELFPCDCPIGESYLGSGGKICEHTQHDLWCPRRIADWLLAELLKPREERRDYLGRAL